MCSRMTCSSCGKPSWRGCGAHVEMVLGDVPKADRCKCREAASSGASNASVGSGALWDLFRKQTKK